MARIKKIIVVWVIVLIAIPLSAYLVVTNLWRISYSKSEMKELAQVVQSQAPLPEIFYQVHLAKNKKPESMSTFMISGFFKSTTYHHTIKILEDEIELAAENKIKRRKSRTNNIIHSNYFCALGLRRYLSDKQCADYNMRFFIETLKLNHNKQLHINLANKEPEQMTLEDVIELYIIEHAPGHYNKERHPDRFERAKNYILNELNKTLP